MLALITNKGTVFPAGEVEMSKNLEAELMESAISARKMGCTLTTCIDCGFKTAMEIGDYVVCPRCGHILEY